MVLSSADDFMCYECDARDPECKATNERDISQTACPTEKCLISGTVLCYLQIAPQRCTV